MSVIVLHEGDDVGVARRDLSPGEEAGGVTVRGPVPSGHKLSLRAVPRGAPVRKYGQPIGLATRDLRAGEHVHVGELSVPEGLADAEPGQAADLPPLDWHPTFEGYRRASGRVGTRNYVGVLTTVNCSATVARQVARRAEAHLPPGVDGVVPLTHTTGCGTAASGPGIDNLRRTLAGFATHPNFAGVLIVGLGCEANQMDPLLATQDLTPSPTLRTLGIQEAGGTLAAIERGVAHLRELMDLAAEARRETVPASHLTLALQCGGSDAWSGVTANPSLGACADLLVRAGGTVVLAETPEIYGAEALLLRRAESRAVADALLERLRWWERYVAANGQALNNNPSPGNLAGGLSTILEKSLGAVAKSGTAPLRGVYRYGQRIDRSGFVFMDSPGYDPCSITGEVASGANLVCFTTGRGSVFGGKPVPSLKIASNDALARDMEPDIDLSAAAVADGTETTAEVGRRLFDLALATASGRPSKSEALGFGDFEFVPWQIGATV